MLHSPVPRLPYINPDSLNREHRLILLRHRQSVWRWKHKAPSLTSNQVLLGCKLVLLDMVHGTSMTLERCR